MDDNMIVVIYMWYDYIGIRSVESHM